MIRGIRLMLLHIHSHSYRNEGYFKEEELKEGLKNEGYIIHSIVTCNYATACNTRRSAVYYHISCDS